MSGRQPVRQYCAQQVQHLWTHLAQSLHLLYEELAFFCFFVPREVSSGSYKVYIHVFCFSAF